MAAKRVKSYCRSCGQDTHHDVLAEHSVSHREDYSCDIHHQILSCRGCETHSFRKVFVDIEAAYPTGEEEWEVPEEVDIYPRALKGHRDLENSHHIPTVVSRIYSEVLLSIKENAKILAGLGLRGIVEAVCNDLSITGRNLEVRIDKLASGGHISKSDAERLHAIRFMGNDAAHDIKRPEDVALTVALQIVEHLLSSVYILEKEADGSLEPAISRFEKFGKLLVESLSDYSKNDEVPLAQFLGKDLRRVKESVSVLEQELISKIGSGDFKALSVGKIDHYQGSKDKVQHFVVT